MRCHQVDALAQPGGRTSGGSEWVKEHQESEKEIHWWNRALPFLRQKQEHPPEKKAQDVQKV